MYRARPFDDCTHSMDPHSFNVILSYPQVTEYMAKGSVHDLLHGGSKASLSLKRKMSIAKQAALGMNWCSVFENFFYKYGGSLAPKTQATLLGASFHSQRS